MTCPAVSRTAFFVLLGACSQGYATDTLCEQIEALTGNHTRLVWARGVTDVTEADVESANYALMGFDTRAGGERILIDGPVSCANPWITADGEWVVFTDRPANKVNIIGFNGQEKRFLVEGYGLCVWKDPLSDYEWVYVSDKAYGDCIHRYRLDDVSIEELIWNKTPVSIRFSVSADGRRGGGEFPWNKAGVVTLPNGEFAQYGSGCNAMIAPDNSYRFFHMVGTHREIHFYDSGGVNNRVITLHDAPGIEGGKTWIPKWTNDPRYFTVAGPGGNDSVRHNIHLGRFNEEFTDVESWVQITDYDSIYDMYAYGWIGPQPQIVIAPPTLSFLITADGSGVRQRDVVLTSQQVLPDSIRVHDNAGWLLVSAVPKADSCVLINSVATQNLTPGLYSAVVEVSGDGIATSYYHVQLRIEGTANLANITINPADITLFGIDTAQFKAQGKDQFGETYATKVDWSVSGGGTIDSTGTLISSDECGTYTVTATSRENPAITGQAYVSVYDDIRIVAPEPGAIFASGEVFCVRWVADTNYIRGVAVYLSTDGGTSWVLLNSEGAVTIADTMWGNYCRMLPDTIDDGTSRQSVVSEQCRIRVCKYPNGPGQAVMEGDFTIRPSLATRPASARRGITLSAFYHQGAIIIDGHAEMRRITVLDLKGRHIARAAPDEAARIRIPLLHARGVYVLCVQTQRESAYFRIPAH